MLLTPGGASVPGPQADRNDVPGTHGGFSQYLFRFKLRYSPHCACDPAKIQDVLHVLEDCDMFLRERAALEVEIDVLIVRQNFPGILEDITKEAKVSRFLRHGC
ncbi:hypothetical protein EVAR_12310_1 [Eumeta japonica]|uniref:Uncharacterized protein n=1 Tax=Eumeta variegata TaxID=151549 RepID=A0A4C1TUA4_EUMVA|nr:hypothetical protein EVAR_12310_1 [Eumeta japonica]